MQTKVRVSLTPLLDLLIIMIFAQYVSVQRAATSSIDESNTLAESAETESKKARGELEDEAELRALLEKEMKAKLDVIRELNERVAQLEEEAATARGASDDAMRFAASAMKEVIGVSAEKTEELLESLSREDRAEIREQLNDLRGKSAEHIVRHLRKMTAIQNRCSVWEVHIDSEDRVLVTIGDFKRGPKSLTNYSSMVKFLDEMCAELSFPQPKSLVFVLLTFSDTTRGNVSVMKEVLREMCQNYWPKTYDGASDFDFANLGYVPEMP